MKTLMENKQAYTAVIHKGEYKIGLATENESGYLLYLANTNFKSYDAAQKWAAEFNLNTFPRQTKEDNMRIVLSSMRDNI